MHRADPPGQMATAADGTHPTGMHSCLLQLLLLLMHLHNMHQAMFNNSVIRLGFFPNSFIYCGIYNKTFKPNSYYTASPIKGVQDSKEIYSL